MASLYDIFRNDDLDANTWANDNRIALNPTAAERNRSSARLADKQNDYGLTMGGPVRIPHLYNGKDKTFFFFSWEQYKQTSGGVSDVQFAHRRRAHGRLHGGPEHRQRAGHQPLRRHPDLPGRNIRSHHDPDRRWCAVQDRFHE